MKDSFPMRVNECLIMTDLEDNRRISYYFDPIIRINQRVQRKMTLSGFNVGERQLKRLIISYRHVKAFGLRFCELSLQTVPDFSYSLKTTQIESIDFEGSEGIFEGDNEGNPDGFQNLMIGLATSPEQKLKLTRIKLTFCSIELNMAQAICEESGFDRVNIEC
ncbi:unnamed protein product [Moneuplotes crassus]|uniref:Uncharacterized protein n=1 Tax=Euplotes crassus TaxID=5936 RepID=A0AAD1URS3_EUPCR|nr:unnamed protein product [Moneuplotes crassus]